MPDETVRNLKELLENRIPYIDAADGMLVDSEVWRHSHDRHRLHRLLHAMTSHRPGIVYGLEVLPMAGTGNEAKVLIAPGVAIDGFGRTIVQPEPEAKEIRRDLTQHILINYDVGEAGGTPIVVPDDVSRTNLLRLEGRLLAPDSDPPRSPAIELARIHLNGKRILEAVHPSDSGLDIVNLLHRQIAFPHCYADVAVKEVSFLSGPNETSDDSRTNRPGLWNLLHEGNGRGFHLGFCPPDALQDTVRGKLPALLYMAGSNAFLSGPDPFKALRIDQIKECLKAGGILFAEACGDSDPFKRDFVKLAQELNAPLKPLGEVPSSLVTAHYLFPVPPPGGNPQGIIVANVQKGVYLSTYDYGAAWKGRSFSGAPIARTQIQQALEFGLNIVAYAALRQRRTELAAYGAVPLLT